MPTRCCYKIIKYKFEIPPSIYPLECCASTKTCLLFSYFLAGGFAVAHTCAITCANQEKGGLGGQ